VGWLAIAVVDQRIAQNVTAAEDVARSLAKVGRFISGLSGRRTWGHRKSDGPEKPAKNVRGPICQPFPLQQQQPNNLKTAGPQIIVRYVIVTTLSGVGYASVNERNPLQTAVL